MPDRQIEPAALAVLDVPPQPRLLPGARRPLVDARMGPAFLQNRRHRDDIARLDAALFRALHGLRKRMTAGPSAVVLGSALQLGEGPAFQA